MSQHYKRLRISGKHGLPPALFGLNRPAMGMNLQERRIRYILLGSLLKRLRLVERALDSLT